MNIFTFIQIAKCCLSKYTTLVIKNKAEKVSLISELNQSCNMIGIMLMTLARIAKLCVCVCVCVCMCVSVCVCVRERETLLATAVVSCFVVNAS